MTTPLYNKYAAVAMGLFSGNSTHTHSHTHVCVLSAEEIRVKRGRQGVASRQDNSSIVFILTKPDFRI